MWRKKIVIGAFAMVALGAGLAFAQVAGHADMTHGMHHGGMAAGPLSEPGQGAFAALAEVVAVLEADPDTDWSTVNLRALRDHLIDMDLVVRDAVVEEMAVPGGIAATVTGDGAVMAAVGRMVPAHAAELAKDARWIIAADVAADRAVLTATSGDPATEAKIRALGFYGLMASQDHHRAHHWGIATGQGIHSGH